MIRYCNMTETILRYIAVLLVETLELASKHPGLVNMVNADVISAHHVISSNYVSNFSTKSCGNAQV